MEVAKGSMSSAEKQSGYGVVQDGDHNRKLLEQRVQSSSDEEEESKKGMGQRD